VQSIRTLPCQAVVLMSFKPQHHRVIGVRQIGDITYHYLSYNSTEFAKGNCVGIDTELFFPENAELTAEQHNLFKRICGDCPVQAMCLEWALCHEREGIREKARIGLSDPALASKFIV